MNRWLKVISCGSVMLTWFTKASADGKISAEELSELLSEVISIFDLQVELPEELTGKKA